MSDIKLLSCPFCSGMAKLTSRDKMWDSQLYKATWVECEVCGAKTREVWNTTYNDKPNEREKEVIERWNKRKPIDRIVEQLKQVGYLISVNDGSKCIKVDEAIDIVKAGGKDV